MFHFNVLVVSWKGKINTQSPSPRERLPSLDRSSRVLSYSGDPDVILAKTRTWFSQRLIRHSSRDIRLEFSLGHEVWSLSHRYPAAVVSIFFLPFRSWGKCCLHHIGHICSTGRYTHFETGTEKNPVVIRIRRETVFSGKAQQHWNETELETQTKIKIYVSV